MIPDDLLAELLSERERRAEERVRTESASRGSSEDAKAATAAVVAQLRSIFDEHPKQAAACRSPAKRKAYLCTRRSGKTVGENREELAQALLVENYTATYCNETRIEAKRLAWRSDTKDGWVDLLERHGKRTPSGVYVIGGIEAVINKTELSIDFSNGSRLDIFAADDEHAIHRMRGRTKHKIRIDEAQKFRFLEQFILDVVDPALRDYEGQLVLTGTPSEECAGYFYEVTKEEDEDGPPLEGWERHEWSVVDNPHFGRVRVVDGQVQIWDWRGAVVATCADRAEAERVAAEVRWKSTAGHALAINRWKGDEPPFLREWLGRWVKTDALYVYAVHAAPKETLTYAPHRVDIDGWLDFDAAMADMPRKPNGRPYDWWFGAGFDFGVFPDPFAISVSAYNPSLPGVYEFFSWKQTNLDSIDWEAKIRAILEALPNLVVMVGDPAGIKGLLKGWRERLMLPIEDSDKQGKPTWIDLLNTDIRRGLFRFRAGSPLLYELKQLQSVRLANGKLKENADRRLRNGDVPGNHCADANLYSYRHLSHYLYREPEVKPKPGTTAAIAREESRIEAHLDEEERLRKAESDGWGLPEDYPTWEQ